MSIIKVDSVQDTNARELYLIRLWINFNQTTASIRDSENVSSITDNGTGINTVNFTYTRSNANYCVNLSASDISTGTNTTGYAYGSWLRGSGNVAYATGSLKFGLGYPGNTLNYDNQYVNFSTIGI